MEIANRPAIGTRVRVTSAGGEGYDEMVEAGTVTFHYPDGFDVTCDRVADTTYEFTLFDSELASGRAVLEVL